jgi:TonB family protein
LTSIALVFAILFCLHGAALAQEGFQQSLSDSSQKTKIIFPPRPHHIIRPDFPTGRKKKHGLVTLRGIISVQGDVQDLHLVQGNRDLAQSALAAVRQWRYFPGREDGVVVPMPHDFILNFDRDEQVVYVGPDDIPPELALEPGEDVVTEIKSGTIFRVGNDVTAPRPLYTPDPQYSELARKLKYSGASLLGTIVGADGSTRSTWVVRPLGGGLDEEALEILKQWRFQPATHDSRPVAVLINIEVTFEIR